MNKVKIAKWTASLIRLVNKQAYYNFLLNIFSSPPKHIDKPLDSQEEFTVSKAYLREDLPLGADRNYTIYKKLNSDTVLVFAHGWGGSFQNFKYFIQPALDMNFSIIGYDAPAHGRSEGKRTHVIAFKEVMKQCLIAAKDFKNVIVIGQSLGAAAAILAIMDLPDVPVRHAFLLAAPSDLRKIFDDYMALMSVSPDDAAQISDYIKQQSSLDFESDNWRKKQLPDHLDKLMLIHGKNDVVITPEECLSLAHSWGLDVHQDVRILENVGHYNILKSEAAIKEVFSKIEVLRELKQN